MAKKKDPKNKDPKDYYKRVIKKFDSVFDSDEYNKRREMMNRHLKEYEGKWWGEDLGEHDSHIMANYIFSTIQATAPLLTDNKPIWHVRPRDPLFQGVGEMYNKGGEYLWDKIDMDHKLFLAVKDCLLWPVSLMKLWFDPEDDEIAVENDDPRTFALAPGYTDLWKAAWCGTKTLRPMTWVKSRYPDKIDEVKLSQGDRSVYKYSEMDDMQLEGKHAYVYEIWLKDDSVEEYILEEDDEGAETETQAKYPNGRLCTLGEDGVVFDDRPSPFSHGRPPWVAFYDYMTPHSFWGMGEPTQLEDLCREYNLRLQTLVGHAHRNEKLNYVMDMSSGLDPEKVKKDMDKGGNVWVVNPGSVETALRPVEAGMPSDVHLQLISGIPKIIEEISGVTDISKGSVGKSERQSASEVSILIESSYTRTRQRVRNLEWSIERLFRLVVELMQQYYTEPRDVQFKEGGQTSYSKVGNSGNMALEATKPFRGNMSDEEYAEKIKEDGMYQEALQVFGAVDEVYMPFDIEIQTNSTLPTDKQSKANLVLRLAQTPIHPESAVTEGFVRRTLGLEDGDIEREKQDQQKQMMMMQNMGGKQ